MRTTGNRAENIRRAAEQSSQPSCVVQRDYVAGLHGARVLCSHFLCIQVPTEALAEPTNDVQDELTGSERRSNHS